MKKSIVLYNTDFNQTESSKIILGIFDTKQKAISAATYHAKEFDDELTKEDSDNLWIKNQTENRDVNYVMEEYITNEITI